MVTAPSTGLIEFSVSAFVGPETLPLHVGAEKGFFAEHGLSIRCKAAAGSVQQMVGLIDGEYHMAMTAIDNVIAYMEGQGAAEPKTPADLIVFLGNSSEHRPLVAAAGIETVADLKGKRIAVDALNTGFSFMIRQVLEDYGLGMNDYELVATGAPKARWDSIRAGDCAAGLLSKAWAETACDNGCRVLTPEPDPWDNYQGGVYTANRSWAAAHRGELIGFIRAYLKAVDWILERANFRELPALLMAHLPHMAPSPAGIAASELHGPASLLKPGMPLDMDGIRTVIELRRKYGTPPADLGEPQKYLDLSYYEAAADTMV